MINEALEETNGVEQENDVTNVEISEGSEASDEEGDDDVKEITQQQSKLPPDIADRINQLSTNSNMDV